MITKINKMGNLISFMKEVAEGLRKSGNYGTAHVYRSSMNAIIAFNGSRNLSFKKVNQEFLKSFETYLRERIVVGTRFQPICVH